MHAPRPFRALSRLATALFGLLLLSACSSEMRIPGVYRIDIQQGNVITQEQLAALEAGMEKRKVRFILGTPLIADTFNQQRWDYYYSLEKGGGEKVQRIISVYFEGDLLTRVGGDVRAASGPIELPERTDKVVTIPDGFRKQGLFDSLTPDFLSDRPKRRVDPDVSEDVSKDDAERAVEQVDAATESVASAAADSTQTAVESPVDAPSDVPPSTINLDADDERYLGNLLGDLGREGAPPPPPKNSVAPSGKEGSSEASEESNNSEEQSLLTRLANRFGFGKKDPSADDGEDDEPKPLFKREIN